LAGNSKETRDREAAQAKALYEADAQAVREKTVRLKALRLAKEAAELEAGVGKKSVAPKPKKKAADPKAKGKGQPLSDWLKGQQGAGRRS
jgi:hypothetical protein